MVGEGYALQSTAPSILLVDIADSMLHGGRKSAAPSSKLARTRVHSGFRPAAISLLVAVE